MIAMRRLLFVAMPFVAAAVLGACGTSSVLAPVETVEVEVDLVQDGQTEEDTRPKAHRVKPGETLIEIAMKYGLDDDDLALWNGIADKDVIFIGDSLRLAPSPAAPAVAPIVKSKAPVVISGAPITNPQGNGVSPISPVIVPGASAPVIIPDGAAPTFKPGASSPQRNITNLPVKESPLAVKHPYSAETLAKVRRDEKPAGAADNNAPKPTLPATTPPSTSGAEKPAILLAQRRRFGVDWSWPSAGKVIEKFSESNKGINITGELGAPVYAGAAGKVVYVGTGVKSYGRLVIIKHSNDYLSAYAHNQTILVNEGDQVKRGQQIATLGKSGAPMPMLHFEIRKAGKPFDPLRVLPKL